MNLPNQPKSPPYDRYELVSKLGSGGAGAVHLVRDRETGDRLALKRLLNAGESSLQRLKREFRSLANFHHPNLVKLYELGQDETSAFFTMEYLEGEDLKRHLGVERRANDNAAEDEEHILRVLRVFEQLATAVCALHSAGLLHRDLKPSNVLVTQGRVVVLDFGITLEVGESAATVTQANLTSGTPAYMAPEQALGEHLGEPNDWYAFGVMLYEALSGTLPIEGSLVEILQRKLVTDPTPIEQLVPSLHVDVCELCMKLLRREPAQRPHGSDVLAVLRAHMQRSRPAEVAASLQAFTKTENELSLFGRDAELAALWDTFRKAQVDGCRAVHVFGESGSGKSLLLDHFCDEVGSSGFRAGDTQPLVLRSRCYERESLPFKALDGATDALVQHLLRETSFVVSRVLPKQLMALTQLFPVFKALPVARQLLQGAKLPLGMSQARAEAEAGLHDMLQRLTQLRPVVLWIDDLQWADLDSIGIVNSWLRPPYIEQLVLVFSYRSEELTTSPSIRALRERANPSIETLLPLRPLGDADVRALCEQRFSSAQLTRKSLAPMIESIVREARGSPFLASQLAQLAITLPSAGADQLVQLSLQELVRSRSQTLSNSARQVLSVLSNAGRPIPLWLAMRASGISGEMRASIHELQTLHLIRTRESAGERLIEVYHDRLREVVQSLLTVDERLLLDRALLEALRNGGSTDSDWMHTLAQSLGDVADALRYGLLAAARASQSLAFERAADLYERCVQLAPDPSANDGELWHKLALAYSYAGHGAKAAQTYLHAAEHVSTEQALRFERAAASQLLCTGRFEEGEAVLLRVLDKLNLRAPGSETGLYAALGWERLRASVRGLSYTARERSEIPFVQMYGSELYTMLSMETAAYDPLRAAFFQACGQRMALDLGDHELVARSLCAAATIASIEATARSKAQSSALLAKAEVISSEISSPLLRMNIAAARAICAYLLGDVRATVDLCQQAEHALRTTSGDSEYHYRFTLAAARLGSLLHLGQFRSAEAELQSYLNEAAATGNISAELHVCIVQAWVDCNADRAHSAIARLDRQREQLPRKGFGILHCLHMVAVHHIGCATGNYDWALDTTREAWQSFLRSVVGRTSGLAMCAYEAHARLLICSAVGGQRKRNLTRELRRHRAELKSSQNHAALAHVSRIEARLCLIAGDKANAMQHLSDSIRIFERAEAPDHMARDRHALGRLSGGEDGAALANAALAELIDLGVAAPLHQLRGYYPELF